MLEFMFSWIYGWLVSAIVATILMPIDTVRRVNIVDTGEGSGTFESTSKLVQEGGIVRLWRGTISNIARSWAAGMTLAAFDIMEKAVLESSNFFE